MRQNQLHRLLFQRGFQMVRTNLDFLTLFVRQERGTSRILLYLEPGGEEKVTVPGISHICEQLTRREYLSGSRNVELLLVLTVNTPLPEEWLHEMQLSRIPFWILDERQGRVLRYEGQPEDFCGIYGELEQLLPGGEGEKRVNAAYYRKRIPFVTLTLAALNLLVYFLAQGQQSGILFQAGVAYWPNMLYEGEWYRLFTSMFLHFGLDHLANNMLMLILLGIQTETYYGHIKTAGIYLFSGIAGGLCSFFYHMLQNQYVLCAGASGAVYGLLGALVISLYNTYQVNRHMLVQRILLVAALVILSSMSPQIDLAAHVGGLAAGFAGGMIGLHRYKE